MYPSLLSHVLDVLGDTLHLSILFINLSLDLCYLALRVSYDFHVALDVNQLVVEFSNLPAKVLFSLTS